MLFIESPKYKDSFQSMCSRIVDQARSSEKIVAQTYGVEFTKTECEKVILYYIKYAIKYNTKFISQKESSYLSDPFFKYIVSSITGSSVHTWENKGLRDRVWVYLVKLKSIASGESSYNKFYNPAPFQKSFANQPGPVVPPSPIPGPSPVPAVVKDNKKVLYAVGALAAVAVGTKFLKMW